MQFYIYLIPFGNHASKDEFVSIIAQFLFRPRSAWLSNLGIELRKSFPSLKFMIVEKCFYVTSAYFICTVF